MTIAIGVLLIAVAAAFVAAPFFTAGTEAERTVPISPGPTDRQALERQKLDAYAAIKEAEFDYRTGKLSDDDFAATRNRYSARALEAIAALEAPSAASPRPAAAGRRPARIAFCPNCGHTVPPRANFCPGCGCSLKEAVA